MIGNVYQVLHKDPPASYGDMPQGKGGRQVHTLKPTVASEPVEGFQIQGTPEIKLPEDDSSAGRRSISQ